MIGCFQIFKIGYFRGSYTFSLKIGYFPRNDRILSVQRSDTFSDDRILYVWPILKCTFRAGKFAIAEPKKAEIYTGPHQNREIWRPRTAPDQDHEILKNADRTAPDQLILKISDRTAPDQKIFENLAPHRTGPKIFENLAPTRTEWCADQAVRGSLQQTSRKTAKFS